MLSWWSGCLTSFNMYVIQFVADMVTIIYNKLNWCHPPTTCSKPALAYLVGGKQKEIETKLRYTKYMTYCTWLIEIQIVRQLAYVPS